MGTSSPCIPGRLHRTGRVPTHSPIPNLPFAWDRLRPFPGNPGQRFKSLPGQAEFPSASSSGLRELRLVTPRSSHLSPPPESAPRRLRASNASRHRAAVPEQRLRPATRAAAARFSAAAQPSRPLTHPGGSGGVSIVTPLGLQYTSTDRRRQHHSSRGHRHCPSAEPRSIRPGGGAARLTARHHLRRWPPRPWPARPSALCQTARLPRLPECGTAATAGRAGSRARPLPGSARRRRRRDGTAMRPPAAAEDPSLGASPSSCSCC